MLSACWVVVLTLNRGNGASEEGSFNRKDDREPPTWRLETKKELELWGLIGDCLCSGGPSSGDSG